MSDSKSSFHNINYGMAKKTFKTYIIGFMLCIVLTLIPFYSIILKLGDKKTLLWVIVLSAIAQFFVQVICFLRMNYQNEEAKTNVLSFIFSGVVLLVIIGGSLWIMTSLNYFMMH
mgnify:FL=1